MDVVRFLERKWVIRFFGVALIISPFFNMIVQFLILNSKSGISWRYISISSYLLSGSFANYFLSAASIIIGIVMLNGSTKAWKFVLALVGSHLLLQVINYKSKMQQGSLAWMAFSVNFLVFIFIADQLVWKVKVNKPETPVAEPPLAPPVMQAAKPVEPKILHLSSYKKILFSFDSDKPWGRLMTLTSHQLIVNCFTQAPKSIESKVVQISFTKDLILDIKFDRQESNLYYFTPIDMDPDKVTQLNQWLKRIAV